MQTNHCHFYEKRYPVSQQDHQETASTSDFEQFFPNELAQTHFIEETEPQWGLLQAETQAEQGLNSDSSEGQNKRQVLERGKLAHSAINLGEHDIQEDSQAGGRYETSCRSNCNLEDLCDLNRGRSCYTSSLLCGKFFEDYEVNIYSVHDHQGRCSGTLWCLSSRDWPFDEELYFEGVRRTHVSFQKDDCHESGSRSTWHYNGPHIVCKWGVVRCGHDENKACSGPLWCLPHDNWLPDRDSNWEDCTCNPNDYSWWHRRTALYCGACLIKEQTHNLHPKVYCGACLIKEQIHNLHPKVYCGSGIFSDWHRRPDIPCKTQVGLERNSSSCFGLRGGHGQNSEEVRQLPDCRHPIFEEGFDKFEENQRAHCKCKECDDFRDGLQPHQQKADARLNRLHARLCAAQMEDGEVDNLLRLYIEETRLVEKWCKANGADQCQRQLHRREEETQRAHEIADFESNWQREIDQNVGTLEQSIYAERGYRVQEFKPRDVRQYEENEQRKHTYESDVLQLLEITEDPPTNIKTFVSKDRCIRVRQCCRCYSIVSTTKKDFPLKKCLGCSHVICSECPSQLTHSTLRVEVDTVGKLV